MRTFLAVVGYAGTTPFVAAAAFSAVMAAVLEWLASGPISRRVRSFLINWLISCALCTQLIVLVTSSILQRQTGGFDMASAAGLACIMSPFAPAILITGEARDGKLDRESATFLLIAGPIVGFLAWFGFLAFYSLLTRVFCPGPLCLGPWFPFGG
jgi:hypothetical protein